MTDADRRLHAVVSGRVQGVSFRYFTTLAASDNHLTGWVRNLSDGTVEVVAEGTPTGLDAFLAFLHEGSPAAQVSKVETRWLVATGEFEDFTVRG